jgi:hypothetical protein
MDRRIDREDEFLPDRCFQIKYPRLPNLTIGWKKKTKNSGTFRFPDSLPQEGGNRRSCAIPRMGADSQRVRPALESDAPGTNHALMHLLRAPGDPIFRGRFSR